jgi:hypothetical protein
MQFDLVTDASPAGNPAPARCMLSSCQATPASSKQQHVWKGREVQLRRMDCESGTEAQTLRPRSPRRMPTTRLFERDNVQHCPMARHATWHHASRRATNTTARLIASYTMPRTVQRTRGSWHRPNARPCHAMNAAQHAPCGCGGHRRGESPILPRAARLHTHSTTSPECF